MPYLKLTTNQPLPTAKCEEIKTALGQAISTLGKTESWLMVDFAPESPLYFKGTNEPAAILSVDVYGGSGADAYNAFTAEATRIISASAGVAADRIFIKYAEYTHWGWNGGNF